MFCFDPTIGWSTIVQIFGLVAAFVTVIYQMRAQRSLQRDKHRTELETATYEKIAGGMSFVSPVGVATTFQIIHGALVEAVKKHEGTGAYVPPPFDPVALDAEFRKSHSGLWTVASTIQTYEIVSPNLPLFREALVIKLRQLAEAYIPLVQVLPYVLISEKGINDPEKLVIPNEQDFVELQSKIDVFNDAAYDVASFLHDIQVEMQNSLLGSFFKRKIAARKPKDDSFIVLTSDDKNMLDRVKAFVGQNQ